MIVKVSRLKIDGAINSMDELNFQLQEHNIDVDDIISIQATGTGFLVFYKEVIV